MLCRLGDFDFDISCRSPKNYKRFEPYAVAQGNAGLSVEVSDEQLKAEEKTAFAEQGIVFGPSACEFTAVHRQLADWLPLHNAFVMHSAVIEANGEGIAFAAHSGTGKTTHMLLWQRLLGEKMIIVNGDKPIIRFFDGEPDTPYAYGTPWNGKEAMGCNKKTRLRHICLIERADENSAVPLETDAAVSLLFNQTYMPRDPAAVAATMAMMNRLIHSCRLWRIRCNMDISAAETAYKAIFG